MVEPPVHIRYLLAELEILSSLLSNSLEVKTFFDEFVVVVIGKSSQQDRYLQNVDSICHDTLCEVSFAFSSWIE